jgi:NAD(P)-dependent dehydrogenase (short-subunit alcohol dehydrogenase family)
MPPMDLGLSDKRAVVTGASRGIGLAVARALVAEGAAVALIGRDRERLEGAAARLRATGPLTPRVLPVVCDTGSDAAVAAMADTVRAQFGPVDVLVNCAAKVNTGPMRDEDLDEHLNVKVKGYLRCARTFAPGMAERGWGRIINVSGLAARQTGSVVGSVRNVAVAAMTKNLADEYGAAGINVTVVHPGMTRTERTPDTLAAMAGARDSTPDEVEAALARQTSIGRMVTAAEVADVIVFLASPRSVSITGDPIAVGGGARGAISY